MRLRLFVLLVVIGGALSLTPAAADCAGPTFEVDDRKVRQGDRLAIRGTSWGDACNDTTVGLGCDPPPLGDPIEDIVIVLRHKTTENSYEVATVDADEKYSFEVVIEIPDVRPGRYVISDEEKQGYFPGTLRVTKS